MSKTRKQYSSSEKVSILREHLLEKRQVSEICEEKGLQPSLFYRWQKTFFEGGAAAFDDKGKPEVRRLERQVAELQKALAAKTEVVAEITEEYIRCKKNIGAT